MVNSGRSRFVYLRLDTLHPQPTIIRPKTDNAHVRLLRRCSVRGYLCQKSARSKFEQKYLPSCLFVYPPAVCLLSFISFLLDFRSFPLIFISVRRCSFCFLHCLHLALTSNLFQVFFHCMSSYCILLHPIQIIQCPDVSVNPTTF